jgi:hypothetical protein
MSLEVASVSRSISHLCAAADSLFFFRRCSQTATCRSRLSAAVSRLADYSIEKQSTLHLVVSLLGGSAAQLYKFVDVSNEAGLQHLQWNPSAPKWFVAGRGLNLEGRCTNSDCEAYNKMVIMPVHYGVFDVLLDSNATTTCCPCCEKFVQPLTCAFSRCEWKWTGLKGQTRACMPERRQGFASPH